MDFVKDDRGNWMSNIELGGRTVRIRIDPSHPPEDLSELAERARQVVEESWEAVQRSIVDSLLATYNEAWADPAEGYPLLSEEEFLAQIKPRSVAILDEADIDLFFGDGGLFGGHRVVVTVATDGTVHAADLAG